VGFYCTDENLGSRMKIFLSVIDSYNEIMDFIFFYIFFPDEFRFGAWEMFLSQLNVLHWCSPVSSVGKDGWNESKSWSKSKIAIYRIYLSDGWTHNLRSAKHILHS
jgi:hypothetical protein